MRTRLITIMVKMIIAVTTERNVIVFVFYPLKFLKTQQNIM